jgi:NAD(P)-dependent dehydrogenase (short-subunit alcohol dehydrogenase family)
MYNTRFNPEKDIPDLSGKVIIVTGGSSGLGKESIHQLSKHNPSKIYLDARTSQRGNAAIQEIVSDVPSA